MFANRPDNPIRDIAIYLGANHKDILNPEQRLYPRNMYHAKMRGLVLPLQSPTEKLSAAVMTETMTLGCFDNLTKCRRDFLRKLRAMSSYELGAALRAYITDRKYVGQTDALRAELPTYEQLDAPDLAALISRQIQRLETRPKAIQAAADLIQRGTLNPASLRSIVERKVIPQQAEQLSTYSFLTLDLRPVWQLYDKLKAWYYEEVELVEDVVPTAVRYFLTCNALRYVYPMFESLMGLNFAALPIQFLKWYGVTSVSLLVDKTVHSYLAKKVLKHLQGLLHSATDQCQRQQMRTGPNPKPNRCGIM